MKRLIALCCVVLLLATGFALYTRANPPGITKGAVIEIGSSERFTEKEIRAAMGEVLADFHWYTGCRLTRLSYNEEKSDSSFREPGKDRILLMADFTTSESSGSQGFDENTVYTGWQYELRRSNPDHPWRIESWGYD